MVKFDLIMCTANLIVYHYPAVLIIASRGMFLTLSLASGKWLLAGHCLQHESVTVYICYLKIDVDCYKCPIVLLEYFVCFSFELLGPAFFPRVLCDKLITAAVTTATQFIHYAVTNVQCKSVPAKERAFYQQYRLLHLEYVYKISFIIFISRHQFK